jgi:lytic murein transglycosylase
VREQTIAQTMAGLTYNPRVIAFDRNQPGSGPSGSIPAFEPYRRRHVDAGRIARGRRVYAESADMLAQISRRYGVPASVVLAIWGHESNFGSFTGNFDLARSLATLAYDGRRRELFADEFVAVLKMIDRGVPRQKLVGSWAGAFGNPQFLPSVYLRVAQDADGDGLADIWSSRIDTLASIANYFRDAGWREGQPWGFAVTVPATLDHPSGHGAGQSTLSAGLRPAQSLAHSGRMAGAGPAAPGWHLAGRRRYHGHLLRTRRPRTDGLSANGKLSSHPRLQLLELLRPIRGIAFR